MPCIYETTNLYNKHHNIIPYRYIGSDQNDNVDYYGSSETLKEDLQKFGILAFQKKVLKHFDYINNKELRKEEAIILKQLNVKKDPTYYNKTDVYAPGGGVKGMKHRKKKVVSEKWRESHRGWIPSVQTRAIWKAQRTGKKATKNTKELMSSMRTGDKNPNALAWTIITPTGSTINTVSLRKWCADNNVRYLRVYSNRDGYQVIKHGKGKGGPAWKQK